MRMDRAAPHLDCSHVPSVELAASPPLSSVLRAPLALLTIRVRSTIEPRAPPTASAVLFVTLLPAMLLPFLTNMGMAAGGRCRCIGLRIRSRREQPRSWQVPGLLRRQRTGVLCRRFRKCKKLRNHAHNQRRG